MLDRLERLAADPERQLRLSRFIPGRWIARRRSRRLFDLTAGFVYAQLLSAATECGLFSALAAGARPESAVRERCGIPDWAFSQLLQGLEGLGLIKRGRGKVRLTGLGYAFQGNRGAQAMVMHNRILYGDLADPLALLRGERGQSALGRFWGYLPGSGQSEAYSDLMAVSLPWVAELAMRELDLTAGMRVVDLGGGNGAFLAQLGARHADLDLAVFDRADVLATMPEDRTGIDGVPGDLWLDPLPQGADLYTLVRVLHDHDDEPVDRLLARVAGACTTESRLVIVEPMAGPGLGGLEAYFSAYFLALGQGRLRTPGDLAERLRRAGFAEVRCRRTRLPILAQLIVASGVG